MIAKQNLVVDSNIITNALNPTHADGYAELFKELEIAYLFAVTGFTNYELLRSSSTKNRKIIDDYISKNMIRVGLSGTLMAFAARIYYLYSIHTATKHLSVSDGDIINAALSIIKNCPLITIDNNDYPTPFFEEVDRHRVEFTSKKVNDMIDTVVILKPDMINLKQCAKDLNI